MGQIITFYSWKGGVGRTFALANCAVQLCRRGRRVLMVDFDLEAPGLDRYFATKSRNPVKTEPAKAQDGLIGLLHEALESGIKAKSPPSLEFEGEIDWEPRVASIEITLAADLPGNNAHQGRLDLLPAGTESEEYSRRFGAFSWDRLFAKANGGAWVEKLRAEWRDAYDFVLIDSRTGLTDTGGICTVQLPDSLVLVFTANDQSLDGGLRAVQAAQNLRRNHTFDRAPLNVVPLLSRWEGGVEVDYGENWLRRLDKDLHPLTDVWLPSRFSPRLFVERTKVPHVARFTFGEPLPVLTHSLNDAALPGQAIDILATLIDTNLADTGRIIEMDAASILPDEDETTELAENKSIRFRKKADYRRLIDERAARLNDIERTRGPGSAEFRRGEQALGEVRSKLERVESYAKNRAEIRPELSVVVALILAGILGILNRSAGAPFASDFTVVALVAVLFMMVGVVLPAYFAGIHVRRSTGAGTDLSIALLALLGLVVSILGLYAVTQFQGMPPLAATTAPPVLRALLFNIDRLTTDAIMFINAAGAFLALVLGYLTGSSAADARTLHLKLQEADNRLRGLAGNYDEARRDILETYEAKLQDISDDYNIASSKIIRLKTRLRISLDEEDLLDLADLGEASVKA